MFFYDGCALTGNLERAKIVSTYANGDAMAIIQNRVGVIGCHPESQKYWYKNYISEHWHEERTHKLLLDFVNTLTENDANIHISKIEEEKSSRKENGGISKVERFLADNFIL
jgi:c-di-AMP phosphodiesterase-like protein